MIADGKRDFLAFFRYLDDVEYNGILLLRKNDINVVITYIVNTKNVQDFNDAYEFAKSNGCGFYEYYQIRAYLDGDNLPKRLQLAPEDIIRIQPQEELKILYQKLNINKYDRSKSYTSCNAGLTCFTIDPEGNAFLCDNISAEKFSLKNNDFDYIWDQLYLQRKEYVERPSICSDCENSVHCGLCAPTLLTEYGEYFKKPTEECEYNAKLRKLLEEKKDV